MTPQPVSFRAAAEPDLQAIVRVDVRSFTRHWPAEEFAAELANPLVLMGLAERAGEPLGYVHVRLLPPEAELLNIAVLPEARREGLGRALLTWAQGQLRDAEVERMYLEVRHDNAAALAMYRALGWEQVGIRKRYYSEDGADAVVMALDLDAADE